MAEQYFNIGGLNTYINPVNPQIDGQLIHSVNMVSFPYGAKTKRGGYSPFLGTADGAQVNTLTEYRQNDGTTFTLLRASGSLVYYSLQGTGAWSVAGNGTIANGAHFGGAILDNTFVGGDGIGSTRHTTDGTSFTNTSLAPIASDFVEYQNRIYAMGTASDLFYSTANDGTNWQTSGTSDSSSFKIPGAGKLLKIFKTGDRLINCKASGQMYKWDGYSLTDMTTEYGPTSAESVDSAEDYNFFMNRFGHYGFAGAKPQLLSNAIQRQFYNPSGSGIAGSVFNSIPARCHVYDYYAAVGTVTDDFTQRTMSNCVIKYDFQKNEYLNFDMATNPKAWHSYRDNGGVQRFIFGDAAGQCYQFDSSTSDNGTAIAAEMVYLFTYKSPEYEKKWNWFRGIFNPGCEATIQYAISNSLTYQSLVWHDIGQAVDGAVEYRFEGESRGRFLFLRIYESSKTARWTYYGCSIDAAIIKHI